MFRLFFLGIFFLCRQNYWSQNGVVHFEGTIYDEKNAVIKQALIQITKGGTPVNTIKSDENGNYNLYLPINGEYNISVTKNGYAQKKYTVSTLNIPKERSQIQFATNIADLVLYTKYDKVDYSLFEKPMNKYFYNEAKDNIVFDEEYLKEMKLAMKNFKNAQAEATLISEAASEGERKIAENTALEKAKADQLSQKLKADELTAIKKANDEKDKAWAKYVSEKGSLSKSKPGEAVVKKGQNFVSRVSAVQRPDKTAVSVGGEQKKEVKDIKTLELLSKYNAGVTEEIFQGKGVYVIQRVLVRDDMVWIYQKKIFNWGGVACFRDKLPITEGIFELETRKSS